MGERGIKIEQRELGPETVARSGGSGQIDLDIQGGSQTSLILLVDGRLVFSSSIEEMMSGSKAVLPFGPCRGWLRGLRPIWEPHFATQLEWEDKESEKPRDFYYLRGTQENGQMCWSSPIWVNS